MPSQVAPLVWYVAPSPRHMRHILRLTVLDANLTGVFYSMRAELRRMEPGATIVNVDSILGNVGMECYAPYTAAKHGVLGLTRAAAKEWGSKGIRINATGP